MKKAAVLLLIAALALALCACGASPAKQEAPASPADTGAPVAAEAEAPAESAPAETAPAPAPETEAEETVPEEVIRALGDDKAQPGIAAALNSPDLLTEEDAKLIAFADAGAQGESSVTDLRVKQDREDGRQVYEIDFLYSDVKYNYNVDADTGEITEASGEFRGTLPAGQGDVGQDAAVNAALTHAGLARSGVRSLYVKTDSEHGRLIYEIEFFFNAFEYDYDVDAATGVITEWERSL